MKRKYHRTEYSKVKVKSYHQDDGPKEIQPATAAHRYVGPNEYSDIPEVTGNVDLDAKIALRTSTGSRQHRKFMRAVVECLPTVDENPGLPEAWDGYVSDN